MITKTDARAFCARFNAAKPGDEVRMYAGLDCFGTIIKSPKSSMASTLEAHDFLVQQLSLAVDELNAKSV